MKRKVKGIWIPIEIWELKIKGMSPVDRCVLAEIDSLSEVGSPCVVGNEYLANFLGVSISTISRSISFLHNKGLIKMWFEKNGFNSRRMMASYAVEGDAIASQNAEGASQNDKRASQIDIHRKPLDHFINHYNIVGGEKEKKGRLKKEGIKNPHNAASSPPVAEPPSSSYSGKMLFSESQYSNIAIFRAALMGTAYEVADMDYYHEAIMNWSIESGSKKADWLAAARSWMLRDKRDGKLVLAKTQKQYNHEKSIVDIEQARRLSGKIRI
jgi:Helix-turn-helix domain